MIKKWTLALLALTTTGCHVASSAPNRQQSTQLILTDASFDTHDHGVAKCHELTKQQINQLPADQRRSLKSCSHAGFSLYECDFSAFPESSGYAVEYRGMNSLKIEEAIADHYSKAHWRLGIGAGLLALPIIPLLGLPFSSKENFSSAAPGYPFAAILASIPLALICWPIGIPCLVSGESHRSKAHSLERAQEAWPSQHFEVAPGQSIRGTFMAPQNDIASAFSFGFGIKF